MDAVKAIFKIHSIMASRTNKKEADLFIRNLVSNIMAELQDQNDFSSLKLEKRLTDELQTFELIAKRDAA